MNPKHRKTSAWVMLIASVVGWPVSSVTFAAHEPQTILGLSWTAMIITAINTLWTADVRVQQEDSDE